MVGTLKLSLYGTRDAATNWAEEYTRLLIDIGFKAGVASHGVFVHEGRRLKAYIHGDDFVSVASGENLKWLRAQVENNYELKIQVLGPHKTDTQEVKVLNRIIRWASARQVQKRKEELRATMSKHLSLIHI
mgnify:CR=1 FL=1